MDEEFLEEKNKSKKRGSVYDCYGPYKFEEKPYEEVEYEDILGIQSTITRKEVLDILDSHIKEMTKMVSDEIIRLNGGNKVGAIFVVGGGGRIEGYTQSLAEIHDIQVNRVALRGEEVMGKIEFKDNSVSKDSLIVTPLGICLHFYEDNNSFISVSLNDDRLKLYDNGNVTVVDAVMQIGLDNNALFPRRGDSLDFTLNGEPKSIKGELGEPCVVYLNSELTNLHAVLHANDYIKLIPSTNGAKGSVTLGKLNKGNTKLSIVVNRMNVTLPNLCTVNGEIAVDSYKIQDDDDVEVLDYLTVAQVLELMDINLTENQYVTVNNAPAESDTKVYSRFDVEIHEKGEMTYADLPEDENAKEKSEETEVEGKSEDKKTASDNLLNKTIHVTVNGENIELNNKESYVYVDVFDHIDFDLSKPQGEGIVTLINGRSADFLEELKDGDVVEIYWKERQK